MISSYYVAVNVVSFLLMACDKLSAKILSNYRVSENSLLSVSLLGGAFGGLIGMMMFNHKLKKASFCIKYALCFAAHLVSVCIYLKMVV